MAEDTKSKFFNKKQLLNSTNRVYFWLLLKDDWKKSI